MTPKSDETPATTYRIFKVWVPWAKTEPVLEWADVKATAKEVRIVRASDRAAWHYVTIIKGDRYARSAAEAWERCAADLVDLISGAEKAIERNRANLVLAVQPAVAAAEAERSGKEKES